METRDHNIFRNFRQSDIRCWGAERRDETGQLSTNLIINKGLTCYINELLFYSIGKKRTTEKFYRTEKTSLVSKT